MAKQRYLKPIKDLNGKFTGYYRCSQCKVRFKPHPSNQEAMTQEFFAHLRDAHPPKKKAAREDVNQAAARVIREATEGR
jgi:hypothetical protein